MSCAEIRKRLKDNGRIPGAYNTSDENALRQETLEIGARNWESSHKSMYNTNNLSRAYIVPHTFNIIVHTFDIIIPEQLQIVQSESSVCVT